MNARASSGSRDNAAHYVINDDLKEFLESGVAIHVGTADAEGRPHQVFGWAGRVHENRTRMDVFIDTARADRALRNLEATRRIAVVFADPVSYRSVQLKGTYLGSGAVTDEDEAWIQLHRDAFLITTALVGDPPLAIRNLLMSNHIRLEFDTDSAFDQTPGPEAGRPL